MTDLPAGNNTVLVTHSPNLARAFPSVAADVSEGEALVFGADGKGGAALMGRIKIDEWAPASVAGALELYQGTSTVRRRSRSLDKARGAANGVA